MQRHIDNSGFHRARSASLGHERRRLPLAELVAIVGTGASAIVVARTVVSVGIARADVGRRHHR